MVTVYSSSDSYSEIAGISILSLLENNKAADEIRIFLIDNGISGENKKKLTEMVSEHKRTIEFIRPLDIEQFSDTKINVGRWNISTFYRLFLGTMLPKDVHKILFIDCDTIVLKDLTPLWETDMDGKWLCGADDCRGAAYRTDIGLAPEDNYINNGVLLIDLDAWRENDVEKLCLQFIRDHQGDITYVDQGVQNGVLAKLGKSGLLPPKYNALTVLFSFDYDNLIRLRKPPVPFSREEFEEAVSDPAIVHFQSCFRMSIRPWVKGSTHPYAQTYLAYKARSPWAETPLREDDRTVPQKLLSFGTAHMPEDLMVRSISFVHTKIYPAVRSAKAALKR